MIYHYKIPQLPPSLNRFAGRANVLEYRNLKKDWIDMVQKLWIPKPEKPISRAVVTLEYYFKDHKRRDPDNYSGKMILDGLTKARIIQDDSFHHIDLQIRGRIDKACPRTEITISDLSDAPGIKEAAT